MAWVDSTVNRTENETGVSELVGAIMLMSVIVMAVGIVGVGLLSQPLPRRFLPSALISQQSAIPFIYGMKAGTRFLRVNPILRLMVLIRRIRSNF